MSLLVDLPLTVDTTNYGSASTVTCTNSGATLVSDDKFKQAYYFNGENNFMTISRILDIEGATNFSFTIWVCPDWDNGASYSFLIRDGDKYHIFKTNIDNMQFRDSKHSNQTFVAYPVAPNGQWTHYACTYDNGTWKTYINGELSTTFNYSGTAVMRSNLTQIWIGRQVTTSSTYYYKGKIAGVRIYDETLAPNEIKYLGGLKSHQLQLYLPFNGNSNNQGLYNIKTSPTAITYTTGKTGMNATFNGSTSVINTDFEWKPVTGWTIAAWVKNTDTAPHGPVVRSSTGFSPTIDFNGTNGALRCLYWKSNNEYNILNTIYIPTVNTWNYYVATWDGSKIDCYIDGILNSSANFSDIPYNTGTIQIGKNNISGVLKGQIADLRLYNYALAPSKIKKLSQAPIIHLYFNNYDNLLVGTNAMKGTGGNAAGVTKTWSTDKKIAHITAASGNSNYSKIDMTNESMAMDTYFSVGSKYAISYDIKIISGNNKLPTLYAHTTDSYTACTIGDPSLIGEWQRVYYIKTYSTTGGKLAIHLGFSGCVGEYEVKCFKLEQLSDTQTRPYWLHWSLNTRDLGTKITDGYSAIGTSLTGMANLPGASQIPPRYNSAWYFNTNQKPYTITTINSFKSIFTHCSVSWWARVQGTGTEKQSLFLSNASTRYIGASSTTKDLYDSNTGSSSILYINGIPENGTPTMDGAVRTHPNVKWVYGAWTHYCLVDVNLSSWSNLRLNNYGSAWPECAHITDLRIFNKVLTLDEIQELYNMKHNNY